MIKKPSELDVYDAKNFMRIDFDMDDYLIEIMLESAKGWVCTYTKRTIEDLDNYVEVTMAILVLTSHFYDNRSLETDSDSINYTISKILGGHWFMMSDEQIGDE